MNEPSFNWWDTRARLAAIATSAEKAIEQGRVKASSRHRQLLLREIGSIRSGAETKSPQSEILSALPCDWLEARWQNVWIPTTAMVPSLGYGTQGIEWSESAAASPDPLTSQAFVRNARTEFFNRRYWDLYAIRQETMGLPPTSLRRQQLLQESGALHVKSEPRLSEESQTIQFRLSVAMAAENSGTRIRVTDVNGIEACDVAPIIHAQRLAVLLLFLAYGGKLTKVRQRNLDYVEAKYKLARLGLSEPLTGREFAEDYWHQLFEVLRSKFSKCKRYQAPQGWDAWRVPLTKILGILGTAQVCFLLACERLTARRAKEFPKLLNQIRPALATRVPVLILVGETEGRAIRQIRNVCHGWPVVKYICFQGGIHFAVLAAGALEASDYARTVFLGLLERLNHSKDGLNGGRAFDLLIAPTLGITDPELAMMWFGMHNIRSMKSAL